MKALRLPFRKKFFPNSVLPGPSYNHMITPYPHSTHGNRVKVFWNSNTVIPSTHDRLVCLRQFLLGYHPRLFQDDFQASPISGLLRPPRI